MAPTSSKSSPAAGKGRGIAIGAAVLVAALLLGVFSFTATKPGSGSGSDSGSASDTPAADVSADPQDGVYPELEKLARRDADDPLAQGRADAPVVLVEYADFKCGFCGKFARDTEPGLVKKYVDNGTLRIEWRNFPIFGAESEAAARGAWAAGQQGRFWQFHEAAYAEGAKEKGFKDDRLAELAKQSGVADLDQFQKDLDSAAAEKAVGKDTEEAYKLGATSTPSFLINGRPLAGAQPAETFEQAIEQAAAAASGKKDTGR
ncbi:thioredoxin domain-containing protein [Streptomyces sp. LHD-70]|uniref:DsbA family protein n=1 Tax=Streptomyces sp. LHD-70 TaxID=3072140 RepID=UPI00280FA19B|nr:thioredoxin domain-containing protein [Streptomyces sp. LHD-70]MDQ8705962.1 thioredoxin domain-containing protein [Streptomyces sp. LHD-70]